MDGVTFFLGIIALCMIVLTVAAIIISMTLIKILRGIGELVNEIHYGVRDITPRVSNIVGGVETLFTFTKLISSLFKK